MNRGANFSTECKVEFLSRPENYSERPSGVDVVQTHMSWVFLTDCFAYKLKKPVKLAFLDFSTLARRRKDCLEELRLNRRLAREVYLDVLPLTATGAGELEIAGTGNPVDWLVKMQRLPREDMLDYAIDARTVEEHHIRDVVRVLADFFRRAQPEPISAETYLRRLEQDISGTRNSLKAPRYRLTTPQIDTTCSALQRFLHDGKPIFEDRVAAKRIVEGHGDLRPEHVCLIDPPVIIDCLEFKRRFRILDPADELSFLAMECAHAGAPFIGPWLFTAYHQFSSDDPPPELLSFHMAYRALMRAKLSIWHLDDEDCMDTDKWIRKAEAYLDQARRYALTPAQAGL